MWLVAAFALAGGMAQLVDGTLGMGFGVTSATVLLALGVAPATASAATHAAKLPTTLISGLSHWRVGNVDKAVLIRVAIPGAIGGFLGAVVLTSISLAAAKSGDGGAAALLRCGDPRPVRLRPAHHPDPQVRAHRALARPDRAARRLRRRHRRRRLGPGRDA